MTVANKKIGIIISLVIFALISLFIIAMNEGIPENSVSPEPSTTERYFIDEITSQTLERLEAQPIEGLDASMYMHAYPGLQASDFDAVQTLGDTNEADTQTSADAVITDQGLVTLLENVADRLELSVDTPADIDALLVTISQDPPTEKPAESTEPAPPNALASSCMMAGGNWLAAERECEYAQAGWCDDVGGSFNQCMSACRHDENAQVCIDVCVPVCDLSGVDR